MVEEGFLYFCRDLCGELLYYFIKDSPSQTRDQGVPKEGCESIAWKSLGKS